MSDYKEFERFSRDLKRGLKPAVSVKVNKSEVDLLMLVSRMPNHPFRHYARMIHLEKSSFSYVVDLLVLKGLVEKVEDPEDKRRKSLVITDKGNELVKELGKERDEFISNRLSVLTDEEKVELDQALETVKRLGEKIRESIPEECRPPRGDFMRGKRPPMPDFKEHEEMMREKRKMMKGMHKGDK